MEEKESVGMGEKPTLKDIVNFFVNIQTTNTKEEAFLKGVLFGYGSHLACPVPNWKLMKEAPRFIEIEREMREMFEKIYTQDVEEAEKLLAELQERDVPKHNQVKCKCGRETYVASGGLLQQLVGNKRFCSTCDKLTELCDCSPIKRKG